MVKIICILLLCIFAVVAQPETSLATVTLYASDFAQDIPFNQQDIETGEIQAKQASKDIFKGLEKAKERAGGSQTNEQAMDYGHQQASSKLEDLANRAKDAQTPEDLNPVDRVFLKNLQHKS